MSAEIEVSDGGASIADHAKAPKKVAGHLRDNGGQTDVESD